MTKPHISATQLESYCRCPEAYRRRYIEREIIPPGIAIMKGTGLHRGAEMNMRQKIDSHVDLPVQEIIDASISAFEDQTAGGYVLTAEEESVGVERTLGNAKEDLKDIARVHARQQAPDYQPVLVEQTIRIELPKSSRDLLGIIDLADDADRVVDFKTSGKKKSQADADTSVALTVYAAAFHGLTGREPKTVRLDSIVQTNTRTDRQIVESDRGVNDFAALANRINVVLKGIELGSFPPATPGAWWCGPKWCGYWRTCPYVNSQRQSLVQIGE